MMKKTLCSILLSFLLIFTCLLAACNASEPIFGDSSSDSALSDATASATYEEMIRSLENQIVELQQNQYISNAERQNELTRLQEMLAELKSEAEETEPPSSDDGQTPPDDETNDPDTPSTVGKFLYTTDGNQATITGYTGSDAHLVIPAVIDGYTVTAVADNAFDSHMSLESVIVSNGIGKLGWFAFQGCEKLTSLTIPASVQSIGYSAFSGVSDQFTVYCPDGSFAQQYAQSYGLRSAVI